MKHLIIAAFLAATQAGASELNVVDSSALTVVDGDTVRLGEERIRLEGPDSPEIYHPRCDHEIDVAMQAKDKLEEILAGKSIRIERHGIDRYHRTLAELFLPDGSEAGDLMIHSGLAVRWAPGRVAWLDRAKHWCPDYQE
jgi:endonuclease YncB( thermonuclease family)